MDLRKLEIFIAVAQLKSFSQAALTLHMAQPAVSIAVRKLEESLNTYLFDRSGRKVELTAEGHNLLGRAQHILAEVEDLGRSVGAMNDLLQGELGIACPSMLATYFLPELLSEFLTTHPGLKASVTQAGTTRVEQMLLDDEIELGVTTFQDSPNLADLELVPLLKEQMVLCVSSDHLWSQRRRINISDLQDSPMVVYESGYFIRSKLDQLCAERAVQPDFRMQSNFLPLLLKMVKQGTGSTVGLKIMSDEEPGIVGIPLSPRTDVSMALAKRRGRTISRANQAFLDWAATIPDEGNK
ncbi:MAG: LysR family transcriptional regulator [Proteobacteria bacterium]|nr:LysR family transcriptional regulator [Pseudomonadota bacterium]